MSYITSESVRLECVKLRPDARPPYKARGTDAGYDIYSDIDAILPPCIAKTGSTNYLYKAVDYVKGLFGLHKLVVPSETNIPTGISVSCPVGYYFTIDGRSGLGSKHIVPFRGIIDSGYTGQIMIIMNNFSDQPYRISRGDRIAQICLHKVIDAEIDVVDNFSDQYVLRGTAGFGSSGK
jgi:dUTP pyrophosphatase